VVSSFANSLQLMKSGDGKREKRTRSGGEDVKRGDAAKAGSRTTRHFRTERMTEAGGQGKGERKEKGGNYQLLLGPTLLIEDRRLKGQKARAGSLINFGRLLLISQP